MRDHERLLQPLATNVAGRPFSARDQRRAERVLSRKLRHERQDDGHGNTVITLDAHDAITLSGVLKAQLQAADSGIRASSTSRRPDWLS